jgi:hypothetical protein
MAEDDQLSIAELRAMPEPRPRSGSESDLAAAEADSAPARRERLARDYFAGLGERFRRDCRLSGFAVAV